MIPDSLDLQSSALLLDIDGTILDIAATPFAVRVPSYLKHALGRLIERTGGALAFVSGRAISDIDRLFEPLLAAAVGGHGAEIRLPGSPRERRFDRQIDDRTRRFLAAVAGRIEGVIFEDKGYSLALHFRLAPEQAETVHAAMAAAIVDYPPGTFELLPGKDVYEIKSTHFSKGSGIRELMQRTPFKGRRPVFVGDDVSDEAAFDVMPDFDGLGISVGREVKGLAGSFRMPADVRQWLCDLAWDGGVEARSAL
ncbi:MAG: trehalose-phosphatase [Xanthobacteraceae bacterium]